MLVNDLGKVCYTPDMLAGKQYNVSLKDEKLWCTQDLNTPDPTNIYEIVDLFTDTFNYQKCKKATCRLALPTSLHVLADYGFRMNNGMYTRLTFPLTKDIVSYFLSCDFQYNLIPYSTHKELTLRYHSLIPGLGVTG